MQRPKPRRCRKARPSPKRSHRKERMVPTGAHPARQADRAPMRWTRSRKSSMRSRWSNAEAEAQDVPEGKALAEEPEGETGSEEPEGNPK